MALFPNLRCPQHRSSEIGNVPYIHNIILSFVSVAYYYICTKCTSDGFDRVYLVLSAYGIMWFTMAYLMKWLVRWRFMKGFHYKCPQVVLRVSSDRKTKKQDLEMGVKENVDQDEAIDQGGAVGGRVLLDVVPNRVQEGNVEDSLEVAKYAIL